MNSERAVSLILGLWMLIALGAWVAVTVGSFLPGPATAAARACVVVGAQIWALIVAWGVIAAALGVLRRIGGRG